jgi:hypothetical protein
MTEWGWRRPGDTAQTVEGDDCAVIYGAPDWVRIPNREQFGSLAGQQLRRARTVRVPIAPMQQADGWVLAESDPRVWHMLSLGGVILPLCVVEGVGDGFMWFTAPDGLLQHLAQLPDIARQPVMIYCNEAEDARSVLDELRMQEDDDDESLGQ